MQNSNIKYDLKQRTLLFSKNLLSILLSVKRTPINQNLIIQCLRSGTSIGANYHEADGAESRKDFEHKLGICKKEAQETEYWLTLLIHLKEKTESLNPLLDESEQLRKIFVAIINKSKASRIS